MSEKTLVDVLDEHSIRWVLVADPDYDERMPHVGKYVTECRTCGPISPSMSQSDHQAAALVVEGFGKLP